MEKKIIKKNSNLKILKLGASAGHPLKCEGNQPTGTPGRASGVRKTFKTQTTSNDIIAGNSRILSVYEYCVVIFV